MNLEQFQEAHQMQGVISRELCALARAFSTTGNDKVADMLLMLADDLAATTKTMDKYVSMDIRDRCRESQEALNETLRTVIDLTFSGG